MEAIAKTKHLKGSPRKARLVIDLIRGRNVSQALAILKFTDKRAADPIAKTLRSAIANATFQAEKQNIAIDPDDLFVKSCFVDMGAHKNRRRMRPAPQGRAYREQRHYCHITIEVSSDKPEVTDERSAKAAKRATARTLAEKKTAAPKKAKPAVVKENKKAKADEAVVEETTVPVVAAPAMEATSPKASEASKATVENEVNNQADVANAKDAESQVVAESNATKPADEAQLDKNEELERQ